ncbi:MarR family winged helix-turn-helix transcriptional regulator [Niveispirillum irakense]|uniref:MarR family winged helix-turn-helix transcriptional regulator n=1 Tax=Niveispirillum irakense TaxID=34011 RepID=UPI00040D3B98|nr:MarR family transcriptional regulator [Niveispirillum irakense]
MDQLEAMPGFLIRRLWQISVALFLEETAMMDMTPPQFGLLSLIAAHPGQDQTWLGSRAALDRTTVTGVLDRLEARGLIRREVAPHNRRARLTFPTPEGADFMARSEEPLARISERLLSPLDAGERHVFLGLLRRLVDANNDQSRAPVKTI